MTTTYTFQHTADSLSEALGITKQRFKQINQVMAHACSQMEHADQAPSITVLTEKILNTLQPTHPNEILLIGILTADLIKEVIQRYQTHQILQALTTAQA